MDLGAGREQNPQVKGAHRLRNVHRFANVTVGESGDGGRDADCHDLHSISNDKEEERANAQLVVSLKNETKILNKKNMNCTTGMILG